jgi:error-prone DNA polymerase
VTVLPADVNASRWHASLEPPPQAAGQPAIRLGLEQVYGLGEAAGSRIEAARRHGSFRLPRDLVRRAGLARDDLLHLARAGALASLGLSRRRAVWEAMQCLEKPGRRPLFDGCEEEEDDDDSAACLPVATAQEEVIEDYRTGGLSLAAHPLAFERPRFAATGVVTTAAVAAAPEGRRVSVAGIVLTRQRPATAKGMIFLTIEDETAAANVVVRPDVWETADAAVRRAAVLVVHGRIQRRGAVVHVVATRLEAAAATAGVPLPSSALASLPRMSRDFC